jgi:hypothetical protein
MPDEAKLFTERQHLDILASSLERETSTLQAEKAALAAARDELANALAAASAENAELAGRADVLAAEKAAAETARDEAAAAFESFKADLAEKAAIAERKAERVERVRAAAPHLADDYTGDAARQQRWAQMPEEAFAAHLEDLLGAAVAAFTAEERRQVAESDDRATTISEILTARREAAADGRPVRQTAAFSGGVVPHSKPAGSSTRAWLTVAGHLPATS